MKKALGKRKGGTTPRPTSTAIQKAPSVSPPTKLSTLLRELPWLVAEYRTRLPEKRLLQAKLHEFYQRATAEIDPARERRGGARRG